MTQIYSDTNFGTTSKTKMTKKISGEEYTKLGIGLIAPNT